jgi:hypothetical protein
MQYLLLFDGNIGYANAPQGYNVPKLPDFHVVHSVHCKLVNKSLQCQQMYSSTITYFTFIKFLHASVKLPSVLSCFSDDDLFVLWKHSTELESVLWESM